MKKFIILGFLAFTVSWDVTFTPKDSERVMVYRKNIEFERKSEVRRFVSWLPKSSFSCFSTPYGLEGTCSISNVSIQGF